MTVITNILLVALILVALCGISSSDAKRYGKGKKNNWPVSRGGRVGKWRGHYGGFGKKYWPKRNGRWRKKSRPKRRRGWKKNNKRGRGCRRKCRCTVCGDPHMKMFVGGVFRLPIPCSHTLTNFRTPRQAGRCKLRINGRAAYAFPNGAIGTSFEKLIHVKVEFRGSVFTVIFDGGNPPVTELMGPRPTLSAAGIFERRVPGKGGFSVYNIRKCRTQFKYIPSKASFTIKTSVSVSCNKGLCGNCPRRHVKVNNSKSLILRRVLRYLNPFSPIDNSTMDIYPVCTDLYSTVQNCSPDTNPFPLTYCGPILNDDDIRSCLINKLGGHLALLGNFEQCYKTTCTDGKATTCAGPDQFYQGCAKPQTITNACGNQR